MAQLKLIFHPANEAQDVVWVMGNFGPSKKMANTFKTCMWDMSVCFIRPIQELCFIFNIVCIDILWEVTFVWVDSTVPVCEGSTRRHEQRSSLQSRYVVKVGKGKLVKS